MSEVFTFDASDAERYADTLAAATAIAAADIDRARAELASVAGALWMGSLKQAAGSCGVDGTASRRLRDDALLARVFVRDHFRCTHCGGRVIPRSILVELSDLFPAEIPYDPHYKRGATHPVYWALGPEADHVFAHSRGGAFALDNLATLHAACNTRKADSLAAEPAIRPVGPDGWDGLISLYPALIGMDAGGARRQYHARWGRHYAQATVMTSEAGPGTLFEP